MNEKENLQKSSQTGSSNTIKKGRKPKAEKMEAEKNLEEEKIEEKAVKESHKWIVDRVAFTKTCDGCGAVMRGWAYRETFKYCPMCGSEMK